MEAKRQADGLIVGGGIAGLQAALQLGRYGHSVLVVDAGRGRSTLCRSYHNVLGWPDGISGMELRRIGRQQAEAVGVRFADDEIVKAERHAYDGRPGFRLTGGRSGSVYEGRVLLLATGIMDRFPELPGLEPCLGKSVYVCPDCDGYEIRGRRTIVLGAGSVGAAMALTLSHWSDDIVYVNHERSEVEPKLLRRLEEQAIPYIAAPIERVLESEDGCFEGVVLGGNEQRTIEAERGFIAFGGNRVHSDLCEGLGVERLENRHISTDPRSKMTNVPHVWAAGDVAVHSEQVTIAMGEGSQAAIWMNKALQQLQRAVTND
ncbi:NAD(P)/FAD-dependent oxidoreductase [Paenibacillus koleovorans]|uniref:NAD(P)/FAD-dependent oxidoreductase n=1 Tax=Paenibacillus koleovorans TaxID=121608 RepID=UPI000FD8A6DE|nr:NAD(P)/FAD-dependent oxidoreductase [Paenibacillus koleovorans]